VLGYTPTTDIEQGIPLYINWFLKQEFISKL
jgi:nucleoside-diphosphate-sugar epimerase